MRSYSILSSFLLTAAITSGCAYGNTDDLVGYIQADLEAVGSFAEADTMVQLDADVATVLELSQTSADFPFANIEVRTDADDELTLDGALEDLGIARKDVPSSVVLVTGFDTMPCLSLTNASAQWSRIADGVWIALDTAISREAVTEECAVLVDASLPGAPTADIGPQAAFGVWCNGKKATIIWNEWDMVTQPYVGALIVGTPGDDVIIGTPDIDIIYGGGGNDTICGRGRTDVIFGEDGDDLIFGGGGRDEIDGGAGNDTIDGNSGRDLIVGQDGDDWLIGSSGRDEIYGGPGNDVIEGNSGKDYLDGGTGHDTIHGGSGGDTIIGGGGADTIEGNRGADDITGGSGSDRCSGGWGHDDTNNCEL